MPVDGIDAVVRKIRDLGTSRWQLSNHATSGDRNTEVLLRSAIEQIVLKMSFLDRWSVSQALMRGTTSFHTKATTVSVSALPSFAVVLSHEVRKC